MVARCLIVFLGSFFLGPAAAEVNLGANAYDKGRPSVALRYWLPLARQGNSKAQNNLGVMYERGHGVSKDYKKAKIWFGRAAQQDLAEAKVNLGLLYYSGSGVTQNFKKAFTLFSDAAQDQLPEANHMLGLLNYFGFGTLANPSAAKEYFEGAAVKGYPESQYMLAYLYQSGDLGKKRSDLAYMWSKIASDYGELEIARDLNYLTTLQLDDEEEVEQAANAEICYSSNFLNCPF